jgi:hypothetical protein
MELFLFLDWLMELPSELKREFKNEFSQYQEDKQMRYISTIEEIAIEDNQIDIAKNLLQEGVSIEIISRSTKLSIDRVKELQQQINNVN